MVSLNKKSLGGIFMCEVKIKNKQRNILPVFVGNGCTTKVICNTGLVQNDINCEIEISKAKNAVEAGADIISDASLNSNYRYYICQLLTLLKVPVTTVPLYGTYINSINDKGGFKCATATDFLEEIEYQAKIGVDMMTIHADINKKTIENIKDSKRFIKMTSRGGNYLSAYMIQNDIENPYYEYFDDILDILKKYEVTLSIGSSLRQATICDKWDTLSMLQMELQGHLVERAKNKGVKVVVEGFGHIPPQLIPTITKLYKDVCNNAPLRVLPVATDIAAGYEHINGAIAAAISTINGADVICTVTRSEHLGLPRLEDTIEAVKSAKVAAHIADIAKLDNYNQDYKISCARKKRDWEKVYENSLFPKDAEILHKELQKNKEDGVECTMCGSHCALKMLDEYFDAGER